MKTLFTSLMLVLFVVTTSLDTKTTDTIKDGLYKANVSKKNSPQYHKDAPGGYDDEVTVKIQNSSIVYIGPGRFPRNNDCLLNLKMEINDKGNAVAQISVVEQYNSIKESSLATYEYKITIDKDNLK